MSLQSAETLNYRINNLVFDGILDNNIAEQLISTNQANEQNRKHMLWFCFFKPYKADQCGIERFFRSWGGEALYNSHERDPITGPILKSIGIPCIIEALIPISGFNGYRFEINFTDRYICHISGKKPDNENYEGYTTVNLPANAILDVIKYPRDKFIQLTKCNLWEQSL